LLLFSLDSSNEYHNFKRTLKDKKKQKMAKIYYDFEDKLDKTLKVTELKINAKKAKVVYVNDCSTGKNPEIQICDNVETRCALPFGISSFDETQAGRKNMDFSLRSDRQVNFIRSLDEWCVKVAIENKKTWFPKLENNEQQIKDQYHRLLIFDTTGKNYPPRLHTKTSSDELSVEVHNEVDNTTMEGKFEDIVKGSEGIPIIRIVGFWFQPSSWGLSVVTTNFLLKQPDDKKNFRFVWTGEAPQKISTVSKTASIPPLDASPPSPPSPSSPPSASILLASISSEQPPAKKAKK
jgi:hypothetical protein